MHLSIVSPTLLPPDIGASLPGLVSQICDPGVRHLTRFVSQICDPGVRHLTRFVGQKNDLRVGHGTSLVYGKKTVRNYSAHLPLQSFAVRTRTHVIEHACPLHALCMPHGHGMDYDGYAWHAFARGGADGENQYSRSVG